MSTHLRRSPTDTNPVSVRDLIGYFASGAKPAERWKVGTEFEKFALDRKTGRQIGFDAGIEGVLQRLTAKFGWEGHEEAGRLTALTRNGSTISVEPGGQLELSTQPAGHISELKAELDQHLIELRAVTDPNSVAWVAAGVTPFSTLEEIPLNPRPRHRFMAEYLPARCQYALHMMKATASTQVAYDYSDEADAGRKFALALSLSPIINAAFANAPMFAGRSTGFTSFRGEIWQGMDPDRSGFLIELLAGEINYERWVDHVLDVPLLFIKVDDVLMPPPGITFRQWIQHRWRGRCPTLEDWDIHLSTIFTDVRLKKYLEIRGADATPTPLSIAVPAVWKGLLYNRQALIAATELARAFPASEILDLSQAAARNGLRAQHRGRTIAAWCGDVVSIAMEGLKAIAFGTGHPDESIYLDPMRELLTSGRSPGELWPISESVAVVIKQCEYM